jgi:hypothetical protein
VIQARIDDKYEVIRKLRERHGRRPAGVAVCW